MFLSLLVGNPCAIYRKNAVALLCATMAAAVESIHHPSGKAATSKHENLRRERTLSAAAERLRQVAAASTGRQRAVDNGIYLWEWNCTMPRSLCYTYGRTVKLRQCLHCCEVLLHDLHVALHHIILSRPRRYRVLFEEEGASRSIGNFLGSPKIYEHPWADLSCWCCLLLPAEPGKF